MIALYIQVNVSYSQPGVYFIGIYGAWSGQYGFNYPAPENGVRTYNSFPLDTVLQTEFQPVVQKRLSGPTFCIVFALLKAI